MSKVRSSLSSAQLAELASKQVNSFFPDLNQVVPGQLAVSVEKSLERVEHCFTNIDNRYFFDGENAVFNHLHGDQYAMWLYILANEHFIITGEVNVCEKLFLLNKALHGCDIFYEVRLPSIFLLVHPLGTVLGRGDYQDYLMVYQRCGVGSNHDIYPKLGRHLTLRPGASVLGRSTVGDNCVIAADGLLIDRVVGEDLVYFGGPSDFKTRPNVEKEKIWRT